MFTKISSKTGLVLAAFAFPAAGMTVIATPAAAQSETMSPQQRAEALVAALNGSGGERSRWARDNFLSAGSYRMRVQQFNQLARRTGELTLLSVAEGDNGMVVQARPHSRDWNARALSRFPILNRSPLRDRKQPPACAYDIAQVRRLSLF